MRGPTGSVKGMEPDVVRGVFLTIYDEFAGTEFRPREVKEFLVSHMVIEPEQADSLTAAFLRCEGVEPQGQREGLYVATSRQLIEHRDWRMATGQIDLAGALWVVRAVNRSKEAPPDTIVALRDRCRTAIKQLEDRREPDDGTD